MFNFAKRCSIQLKDVWFKRCGNKRWGSGNDFAKQEVMSLHTQTARKSDPWKQNGGNLPGYQIHKGFSWIKHYDYVSTATTKRHSYSVRFFRLLCLQTGRIRKNFKCSDYENRRIIYTQEINLIGYLHQLLGILNELRCHFQGIAEESERDMDWFEEPATQPIVMISRNGEVGRPRLALAREQLQTLQGAVVFQLSRDIVARSRCQVTGVSSRLS